MTYKSIFDCMRKNLWNLKELINWELCLDCFVQSNCPNPASNKPCIQSQWTPKRVSCFFDVHQTERFYLLFNDGREKKTPENCTANKFAANTVPVGHKNPICSVESVCISLVTRHGCFAVHNTMCAHWLYYAKVKKKVTYFNNSMKILKTNERRRGRKKSKQVFNERMMKKDANVTISNMHVLQ